MSVTPIVALEIGTTKVRALIGEAREDGHTMITGLGECPSRGIRKGEIVDFENALACVRNALTAASRFTGSDRIVTANGVSLVSCSIGRISFLCSISALRPASSPVLFIARSARASARSG